jgi:hypothetical protein
VRKPGQAPVAWENSAGEAGRAGEQAAITTLRAASVTPTRLPIAALQAGPTILRADSIMRADSRAVAIPPGSHRLIAGGAKCPVSCLSCRMIICSLRNREHFFEILLSASLLARRLLIQEFFQTQGLSGIV